MTDSPRSKIPRSNSHDSREAWLLSRARELRKGQSNPERLLWGALRSHRLNGLKFRRQVPIGNYIVDFLCEHYRVIIEVDGDSHQGRVAADKDREEQLKLEGYRVLRVGNDDVLTNLEGVCAGIVRFIEGN